MATKQELEDELKQRDRRIAELKTEIDELRESKQALRTWNEAVASGDEWADKYLALVRDYNTLVRDYVALVREKLEDGTLRDRGRPIAADEEQRRVIFESHEEGRSLRECADDAGVGVQTVRTLLGKIDGSDRTSRRLSKYRTVKLDRQRLAAWKARKRTRDALPKQLHEQSKKTAALLKEPKLVRRHSD